MTSSPSADQYRLPTNVKPTHYDLTIKTDLDNLRFQGLVKVDLDVVTETSAITFNSSELELTKASIYSDALKAEQSLTTSTFDKTQERTAYQLTNKLPPGSKAELKIVFSGQLSGSMMGYYKSSWQDEGKTRYYALTQFEPTAARRAFPCWDEPLLKAKYTITMISLAGTINLSNMPSIAEHSLDGSFLAPSDLAELLGNTQNEKWKITKFQTTPPMSTYLAAYANGDFESLETDVLMPLSGKTIPLRIYTTKDVIHQAQFALDVKKSILPLYEKVFDVEYPLPKLDTLVAHDFDADAMENWGLITGRTNAYLLDPKRPSIQAKKIIAGTQSHEVAHMWFGNITTMEWWNYLYLNEGFATLMGEVIIPDKVFPEWRVNSEFIIQHLSEALALDAKLSSHPIEVDCPDANHINQIFDALSYSKAASVLRMLSSYVGEDNFLKGVSIYLKKNLFANSRTHDLWAGISEATGLDITEIMENWVTKVGFPVITVSEDASGKGIRVRQDRFLETGVAEEKDNETIWNVPLAILTIQDDGKVVVDKSVVLQEREKAIALDPTKPFKLNAGTNGVYRVLYTPQRLAKIAAEAAKENTVFSLEDRLGLVFDSFALSKAGLAKLSSALTLVEVLKDETEYLVWQGIADNLNALCLTWWEHPDVTDKLDKFRRSLFVPLVDKLGYNYPEGESLDASLLRKLAIGQALVAGDEGVIAELNSRFKHYAETGDESEIPAELLSIIFTAATKYGGRAEYDVMIRIHDNAKTSQDKVAAIHGMSSTQSEALLTETFNFISTKAREQDITYFFRALGMNNKARRRLTKYFQDQYDVLYKRFEASFTLAPFISETTGFYTTTEDLEAIQAYFKDKDTSKYSQSLAQSLDSIRARIAYIERSTEDLKVWLGERY